MTTPATTAPTYEGIIDAEDGLICIFEIAADGSVAHGGPIAEFRTRAAAEAAGWSVSRATGSCASGETVEVERT